ncbi:MAG TPA: tRNA pseudouridine(55) synthase, partial [Opitutales bacterium]|nr:tRNA pseudouridine(55) synthase [Opitutales bacterium]
IDFELACSKGTYVRTIGHDFGQKLGCGAHLTALRRTQIDRFSIEEALPLETLEALALTEIRPRLLPVHAVVPTMVVHS